MFCCHCSARVVSVPHQAAGVTMAPTYAPSSTLASWREANPTGKGSGFHSYPLTSWSSLCCWVLRAMIWSWRYHLKTTFQTGPDDEVVWDVVQLRGQGAGSSKFHVGFGGRLDCGCMVLFIYWFFCWFGVYILHCPRCLLFAWKQIIYTQLVVTILLYLFSYRGKNSLSRDRKHLTIFSCFFVWEIISRMARWPRPQLGGSSQWMIGTLFHRGDVQFFSC